MCGHSNRCRNSGVPAPAARSPPGSISAPSPGKLSTSGPIYWLLQPVPYPETPERGSWTGTSLHQLGRVSPGHGDGLGVGEMWRGGQVGPCGRSPTAVPTCQGTLAPLTLLQPFLPPLLAGILVEAGAPGRGPRGRRTRSISGPGSGGFQGPPEVSRRADRTAVPLHWSCCPLLHPQETLPLPLPQFPLTAGVAAPYLHLPPASPGSCCRPRGPWPRLLSRAALHPGSASQRCVLSLH